MPTAGSFLRLTNWHPAARPQTDTALPRWALSLEGPCGRALPREGLSLRSVQGDRAGCWHGGWQGSPDPTPRRRAPCRGLPGQSAGEGWRPADICKPELLVGSRSALANPSRSHAVGAGLSESFVCFPDKNMTSSRFSDRPGGAFQNRHRRERLIFAFQRSEPFSERTNAKHDSGYLARAGRFGSTALSHAFM